MEVRRGIDPIRFYLLSEGRNVGTVLAGPDGVLSVRFTGFPSSALAERAGWLARSARIPADLARLGAGKGTRRQEDLARIEPAGERDTWSVTMAVAPVGTSDVFVLASVRRMWESIRRAGVGRQMVQGSSPVQARAEGGAP
jgi:hypothetical protein